jgi:hypothetical protein
MAMPDTERQSAGKPVHHPTPEELAVEIWEDESPAPEPDDDGPPSDH